MQFAGRGDKKIWGVCGGCALNCLRRRWGAVTVQRSRRASIDFIGVMTMAEQGVGAESHSQFGSAILQMVRDFREFLWGNGLGEYSNRRSTQEFAIRESPGCGACSCNPARGRLRIWNEGLWEPRGCSRHCPGNTHPCGKTAPRVS